MSPIGNIAKPETGAETLVRARERAALIPDLLIEARRVSNTVISGWHGRRKRGIGENFWQFRPYLAGDTSARIDWRRSARDDHLYLRDHEWEAAHTVWLWADNSPSMLYKSESAMVAKQSRALVLVLALAEILSRTGERVGWPGLTRPITARNAAERLATELSLHNAKAGFPDTQGVQRFSDLVLISDFLDPIEETLARIDQIAKRGTRGHLVHIVDPAEEYFPYRGRTEFSDPETGERLTSGRAENLADQYKRLFAARIETLRERTTRLGWSHIVHHTDKPASTALVALHSRMTGDPGYFGASKSGGQ